MYEYKTRVRIEDVDQDGKQTILAVVNNMQNCTYFWLDSEPGFTKYLDEHNLTMVLVYRQVDIVRLADYREHLVTRSSVYDMKGYFGYRNTIIYDEQGKPCALSWCLGVFINLETGKPAKIASDCLDTLSFEEKYDMEYLPRKITLPDAEFVTHDSFEPNRFDIDFNHHVNNVRYVQMACECIEDFGKYSRMRAEYKNQAKLGDTLIPLSVVTDGKAIVKLCSSELTPYCIIEFSG